MGLSKWIKSFLDDRFDTDTARRFIDKQAHKRLPAHTGWLHVFGSLSLLLFIIQTITGVLLLIYYRPTPEAAHQSIQYITANAHFGWLTRQISVDDETISQLKRFMSDSQLVILTATVGLANWTNRFNEALGVELP